MKNEKVEFIEAYTKNDNGDYIWNDNHGKLIRCKNCKHSKKIRKTETFECLYHVPSHYCGKNGNWFCADGEAKE